MFAARSKNLLRKFLLGCILGGGGFLTLVHMLDGEPLVNLFGYVGGILLAACVVCHSLREESEPHDWVMLVGTASIMVYGWREHLGAGAEFSLSMEIAVFSVGTVAFLALFWGPPFVWRVCLSALPKRVGAPNIPRARKMPFIATRDSDKQKPFLFPGRMRDSDLHPSSIIIQNGIDIHSVEADVTVQS